MSFRLRKNDIFVFGSNEAGIHGAGAAKAANRCWGAVYGCSYGLRGRSWAIPTKDRYVTDTLPLDQIKDYINGFKAFTRNRRKERFLVTRIGCGLAGLTDADIAPLFHGSSSACWFDEAWRPWLGDSVNYWGTGELPIPRADDEG